MLFSQLKFVYMSQYKRALRNKRFNHSTSSVDWQIENDNESGSGSGSGTGSGGAMTASTSSSSYSPDGRHYNMHSFYVPHVDNYSLADTTQRAYVFPACGHVYGYHESLDNQPCPLCRKKGPFVPVAFEYDEKYGKPHSKHCATVGSTVLCIQSSSNITSTSTPTYVFNPCGHVTDREVR